MSCIAVMVPILVTIVLPESARSIGRIRSQDPRENTLSIAGLIGGLLPDRTWQQPSRFAVEVGEHRLFGIAGMKTSHLRLRVRRSRLGAIVSSTLLSSPVGREHRIAVAPFYRNMAAFGIGAELNVHSLSLDGLADTHLLCVGAASFARVTRSVAVAYSLENVRLRGAPLQGADTSFHVIAELGPHVTSVAQMSLARNGLVSLAVGSLLRIGDRFETAVGYEDGSGSLKGSIALQRSALRVSIGASLHPTLGVSHGAFVAWWR